MLPPRYRVAFVAFVLLAASWALATAGFRLAERLKVTPERFARYLQDTNLGPLEGRARQRALDRVASMLNRLTPDERRAARLAPAWGRWLSQMTSVEKADLLEVTFSPGVRQMLEQFDRLPEDRRKRAITDILERLRRAQEEWAATDPEAYAAMDAADAWWKASPELQDQAIQSGLLDLFEEAPPDVKAELAPLIHELQGMMESGRLFRNNRRMPVASPAPESPTTNSP